MTEERKPWAISHDTVQESQATKKKSTSSPAVSLLAVTPSLTPLSAAIELPLALTVSLPLHDASLLGK